jgi:hypothetical protein
MHLRLLGPKVGLYKWLKSDYEYNKKDFSGAFIITK